MRPSARLAVTWFTVATAVASALWLAGVEADRAADARAARPAAGRAEFAWPGERAAAGPPTARRARGPAAPAPAASR